jgi:hypothetical protein
MNQQFSYRVRMHINIEQIDKQGALQYPGGMALTQDLMIQADDFLAVAHTLGKFYELAKQIESDQAAARD